MSYIIEKLKKRKPRFHKSHQENILDRFSRKFGGSEKDKFEKGKFFSNNYECYIFATMLGIKNNYKIPFDRTTDGADFSMPIETWKPTQIVDYIIMSVIGRSDWNLLEIERLDEKELDNKITELIILMEEYTNGGFDIMKAKMSEVPHFFESEYAMINLLKE